MSRADPQRAMARLETLKRVFLLVGVLYLGLHFWVCLEAYRQAGLVAALATLVTLGFSDFYWAWTWAAGGAPARYVGEAAIAATVMAFVSWGMRPWTNRYLYRLAAEAIALPYEIAEDERPRTVPDGPECGPT